MGELKAPQRQATEGAHRGQARPGVCALSAGDHGHKGELSCNLQFPEFVISLMLLYCWCYSQNEMLLMEAAMCRL